MRRAPEGGGPQHKGKLGLARRLQETHDGDDNEESKGADADE